MYSSDDIHAQIDRTSDALNDLKDAERNLKLYEMNLRINDPLYSELMAAKNDVQRKIITERVLVKSGDWLDLDAAIHEKEKVYHREKLYLVSMIKMNDE